MSDESKQTFVLIPVTNLGARVEELEEEIKELKDDIALLKVEISEAMDLAATLQTYVRDMLQ